jgi:hypothetical protein
VNTGSGQVPLYEEWSVSECEMVIDHCLSAVSRGYCVYTVSSMVLRSSRGIERVYKGKRSLTPSGTKQSAKGPLCEECLNRSGQCCVTWTSLVSLGGHPRGCIDL